MTNLNKMRALIGEMSTATQSCGPAMKVSIARWANELYAVIRAEESEFMEVDLGAGAKSLVRRKEVKRVSVSGNGKVFLWLDGQTNLELSESEWQRLRKELA